MLTIPLHRADFTEGVRTFARTDEFSVTGTRYPKGIESLTIINSRGYVEVLPYMGQIIWDAEFDDVSLRMTNMFSAPQPCAEISDTYGCFAFHSGLLAGGCPSPEDTHPLHGEFPTASMDEAWLEIDENSVRIVSSYEYVRGFGHHYRATPSVVLRSGSSLFDIDLAVTNLSAYAPMPLQYMCHMNYAFVENGVLHESIPADAFQLRRSIPAHVTPTEQWTRINEDILAGRIDSHDLSVATQFDPEIVYFADDLSQYGRELSFELEHPDGTRFVTRFSSEDFPCATRWILCNPDQKVTAFVLPATSRPEGFLAAQRAGTLIHLAAGETKTFHVTTGIKE
ncbi:aldose 1-epimerase family protein [Trueperella sp. LYQ143]|uniref:aldose 1-epimerase family protein n=1 Tax=Trueperella sp. LYQ143 TaxID=3391059 RepID=UPI0039831B9D